MGSVGIAFRLVLAHIPGTPGRMWRCTCSMCAKSARTRRLSKLGLINKPMADPTGDPPDGLHVLTLED
jgi:hypothetical protein